MSTFYDNFHAANGTVINTGAYAGNSGATYGNLTGQTPVDAVIQNNAPYPAVDATAAFAVASVTLGADDSVSGSFVWNGTGGTNNRINILYRAKTNGACYDLEIQSPTNVLALYWFSSSAVRTFLTFADLPTLTSGQGYTLNCEPSGTTQAFSLQRASDNNYWNPSGSWQSGHVAILSTTDGNVTAGGSPGFFVGAGSSESNVMALTAIWGGPAPTTATLTGPTSGVVSQQGTAFTVTLDNPAGPLGEVITPASSGSGDTFQATPSGGNVPTISIPQGATTGTFHLTPTATPGSRNVTITASPSLTYAGSPIAYNATSTAATLYTITGPTGGVVNVPSTIYTILLNGAPTGTVVVTVSVSGGGLSTTITRSFSGSTTTANFTVTPTQASTVTLTPSNNGGLTDPAVLHYSVSSIPTTSAVWRTVSGFAPGLSTVGFTVYDHNGDVYTARTTSGVIAVGRSGYGAFVMLPFSGGYTIEWDDGASPVTHYAQATVARPVVTRTGLNDIQVLQVLAAAAVNPASGLQQGTSTVTFTDTDGVTPIITGTCDEFGNRTGVTLSPST